MPETMTSRERLLCAIDGGKPDRLPGSLHQWQKYHLDEFMGGCDDLEACRRIGLDAQIQYPQEMGQFFLTPDKFAAFNSDEWIDEAVVVNDDSEDFVVHHTVRTPGGELTFKTGANSKTVWVTEHLIKQDDDLDLVQRYIPVMLMDDAQRAAITRRRDEIGDGGILRGTVWGDQAGCWQHAACLMDINELILKTFDDPEWVHALLQALLERKLRYIESMKGAAFDLVETGGGAASSTVISPDLHEKFCLPYDRRMHDALHDAGFRTTYHTCGGTIGLEEHIVANGCDASETLAPMSVGGNQEPWEFAAKIDGRVALIGGVDQFSVVTDGPAEKIRSKVFELFEKVGQRGGYVCSLSDHFFDTPPEHLRVFMDAVRECEY